MAGAERALSQVKWFNEKKGFGFIINPEGDQSDDIFVHYKDIRGEGYKTLDQDAFVSFQLERGPKGYKALDVAVEERAS